LSAAAHSAEVPTTEDRTVRTLKDHFMTLLSILSLLPLKGLAKALAAACAE
jgi:hypothetical protein